MCLADEATWFGGGKGLGRVGWAVTLGVLRLRLRMTPLLKKVAEAKATATATAKATATATATATAKAKATATARATAKANAGILHCVQNDGVVGTGSGGCGDARTGKHTLGLKPSSLVRQ
jgi:hypothetical protein